MANGADEKTAERFARTKFAEAFWQNNGQTPIRVGNRTVRPTLSNTDEVMRNWNATYPGTGFERRLGDNRPYRQKMADVGINQNIRRFIDAMGIDTQPSFSETARLPLLICLFPPESSDMLTVSERWKWTP